jgi:hypothetical protein
MPKAAIGLLVLLPLCTFGAQARAASFTCEQNECRCNGTYIDCKDMERSCKAGSMVCPEDGKICYCVRKLQQNMPQLQQDRPTRNVPPKGKLQPQ